MTRKQKARMVCNRRDKGMSFSEIAAELGISSAYAHELWHDPDGSLASIRKSTKVCPDCGALIRNESARCRRCMGIASRAGWTREKVIEALQLWAAEHGRTPRARDWVRSGDYWPVMGQVYGRPSCPFGSWSEAVIAAGLTPNRRGRKPKVAA